MKRKLFWFGLLVGSLAVLVLLLGTPAAFANEMRQKPTGSIPTVTGTPVGAYVIVNTDQDQINVRSGPSTIYPLVGVLVAGQKVPAMGRSPGGNWIKIAYSGVPGGAAWVYAFNVSLPSGTLPVVEPPPTPTPSFRPTIDPTLEAQFDIPVVATRLPTYTAPPPLVIPTFAADEQPPGANPLPMGLLIIGFAVIGVFGWFISLLRGR